MIKNNVLKLGKAEGREKDQQHWQKPQKVYGIVTSGEVTFSYGSTRKTSGSFTFWEATIIAMFS